MECPYCQREMKLGRIPALRNAIVWMEGEKGSLLEPAGEGLPLSETPVLTAKAAKAWLCEDCRVVLIPVPGKIEDTWDRLGRRWNGFTEKMDERRAAFEAKREETKREKRSELRRKKDPWEVE